jgi:NADH dehydrogenase FAD-containing subunit
MAEVKVHRPTASPHRLITAEVERRRLTSPHRLITAEVERRRLTVVVVAAGTTGVAVADRPQDMVPLEVTPGTGKNCL